MFFGALKTWFLAAVLVLSWAGTGAGETSRKQAYRIAVGLIVLESESPEDGFGRSEYVVTLERHDPAVKKEIGLAKVEAKTLARELKKHTRRIHEEGGAAAGEPNGKNSNERAAALASSRERLERTRQRLDVVRSRTRELHLLLYARSHELSVSGTRMHFADERLPAKDYEGDRVTISLIERDAFDRDLMGRKTIVLDRNLLDKGRVELSTGWVESIELKLVPAE